MFNQHNKLHKMAITEEGAQQDGIFNYKLFKHLKN
jgi:hypothetical protein